MKSSVSALALLLARLLFAGEALGADRHKPDVDPESQDGILLQRIQQEPAQPRKLALLETYLAEYPRTTSIAWVCEQLLPIYVEQKQWNRVIATAERLLAVDPNDLDSAHDALQAAQAQHNPDLIAKYAELDWDLATRALRSPKPGDPEDVPDWSKQMDFARENLAYSEYALAALASAQTDEQKRADLAQALRQRNPQSQFLALAKKQAVIDLATLNPTQALQVAEQGLMQNPDNIDFLMLVADHDMNLEKNLPRVLSYALRIIELAQGRPQPADLTPAEWEEKRAKFTGWANWLAGVVYGKQARYGLSDRYLRAALGYIHEDARLIAAAYFYLGYDNYALAGELTDKGRAIEAVKFSKLCAGMDSPFRSLALKNLEALRNEYNVE